jgi:hypothetical protein
LKREQNYKEDCSTEIDCRSISLDVVRAASFPKTSSSNASSRKEEREREREDTCTKQQKGKV